MALIRIDIVATLCLLLLLASAHAEDGLGSAKAFQQWMARYGKTYKNPLEKAKRFGIFKDNLKQILEFNKNGKATYTLGLNKFADMTNKEFLASRTGFKLPNTSQNSTSEGVPFVGKVPASIDWVKKGVVNKIQDQGSCGSCWAFSTVAAVESILKIKTKKKLLKLSEQQLVDCDTGNYGCNGGWMTTAFSYIARNGITSEKAYPYYGIDETCDAFYPVAKIRGYRVVPVSETELMKAVAIQPVSIAIDAGGLAFQFYSGGIFRGYCGQSLNHAVVIVGYGKTKGGTKYWLVRNSWGTGWGEYGYIKMQKDTGISGGLCGLALAASYPIA